MTNETLYPYLLVALETREVPKIKSNSFNAFLHFLECSQQTFFWLQLFNKKCYRQFQKSFNHTPV